jgi:hypothetical protein
MMDVYCISGMGVDGRLFKNLRLENCRIHHVKWITPLKGETLPGYAMRLTEQIDTSRPFVLAGVSFGGMCSVEIAKKIKPQRTFIISSCKKNSELPFKIIFWKFSGLHRFLGDAFFIKGAMLVKRQFGIRTPEQSQKFLEMLKCSPKGYFSRAVNCILFWKNDTVPHGVIQIHGTKDEVLPVRNIKGCNYIIEGGTHFMVVDRGEEISAIINSELRLIDV